MDLYDYPRLQADLIASIRASVVLGMTVEGAKKGWLKLAIPYSEAIIGDRETGVIHGGAITTLLDTCCGFVSATAGDEFTMRPTLDLRVDYMRPAKPGLPVYAEAEPYRVTKHVVFTRGVAHQGDINNPIAHAQATFMTIEQAKAPKGFFDKYLVQGQADD